MWVDMLVVPAPNVRQPTLARVDREKGGVTGRMIAPGGHGIAALPGGTELLVPSGSKLYVVSIPR
jgi:hypothetical protein